VVFIGAAALIGLFMCLRHRRATEETRRASGYYAAGGQRQSEPAAGAAPGFRGDRKDRVSGNSGLPPGVVAAAAVPAYSPAKASAWSRPDSTAQSVSELASGPSPVGAYHNPAVSPGHSAGQYAPQPYYQQPGAEAPPQTYYPPQELPGASPQPYYPPAAPHYGN